MEHTDTYAKNYNIFHQMRNFLAGRLVVKWCFQHDNILYFSSLVGSSVLE